MSTSVIPSLWTQANIALRNKNYRNAIELYQLALNESDDDLKVRIHFNLELARKRLGFKTSTAFIELEKPADLDDYCFNLIKQGSFFDHNWYRIQYGDLFNITDNPLAHYLAYGVTLFINPSPNFDTAYYLRTHQDVAKSSTHPFLHYVCEGHKEGRSTKPASIEDSIDNYLVETPQYVPRIARDVYPLEKAVRVIAFYLPQFHPIPENDLWWGKDFTEWTNVKPAQPQFAGHYQPHIPDDFLGYYDLRNTAIMHKQISLAKEYGIEGFCFYTYWFAGHRLLQTPVDNYLNDSSLDLPFCICWANENWSRRWDGLDHELLIKQSYSPEDDLAFIEHMSKYLRDPRYILIEGKPLLIVYRPNLFPSMKETADRWRNWCRNNGMGEIFIAYVQSFEKPNPAKYGLDAAVEFPPNNSAPPNITETTPSLSNGFSGNIYDWRIFLKRSENYETENYTLFRGVCPSWDNTARKKKNGTIFINSSPKLFESWLVNSFEETKNKISLPDQRLVFVNAWNEWAEGAHLEPDSRYGYAWLQAVRNAHETVLAIAKIKVAIVIHAYYPEIFLEIIERLTWIDKKSSKLYISTTENKAQDIIKILLNFDFQYSIKIVKNHGRDVLPFLKILPEVLSDGSDLILKVHTKKSIHRLDGDKWRKELYDTLLSQSFIKDIKITYLANKSFGLGAPSDHVVSMNYYWGSNISNVLKLCQKINCKKPDFSSSEFVAGTMFIASRHLMLDLMSLNIDETDFEEESGQLDGTMAHAVERIIGFLCQFNKYKLIKYGDIKYKKYEFADANFTSV